MKNAAKQVNDTKHYRTSINFVDTKAIPSRIAFESGVRLGAVEQMVRDNRAALQGGAR